MSRKGNDKRTAFMANLSDAETALRRLKALEEGTPLTPANWPDHLQRRADNLNLPAAGMAAEGPEATPLTRLREFLESQSTLVVEKDDEREILPFISEKQEEKAQPNQLLHGDNPEIARLQALSDEAASPALENVSEAPLSEFHQGEPNCLATAAAAAAESGTLFLVSGPENPTHLNYLARRHFILLRRESIFITYEQALEEIAGQQAALGEAKLPRSINMISGPSRTADIEQTLTLGAHGPIELTVIIY